MPRTFTRIVALLLVPCLIGDAFIPIGAATSGKREAALVADLVHQEPFETEALANRALMVLRPPNRLFRWAFLVPLAVAISPAYAQVQGPIQAPATPPVAGQSQPSPSPTTTAPAQAPPDQVSWSRSTGEKVTKSQIEQSVADVEKLSEGLKHYTLSFSVDLQAAFNINGRGLNDSEYGKLKGFSDIIQPKDEGQAESMKLKVFADMLKTADVRTDPDPIHVDLKELQTLLDNYQKTIDRADDLIKFTWIYEMDDNVHLSGEELESLHKHLKEAKAKAEAARRKALAVFPQGLLPGQTIEAAAAVDGPNLDFSLLGLHIGRRLANVQCLALLTYQGETSEGHHFLLTILRQDGRDVYVESTGVLLYSKDPESARYGHAVSAQHYPGRLIMNVRLSDLVPEESKDGLNQQDWLWRGLRADGSPALSVGDLEKAKEDISASQQLINLAIKNYRELAAQALRQNDEALRAEAKATGVKVRLPDESLKDMPEVRAVLYAARAEAAGDPRFLAAREAFNSALKEAQERIRYGRELFAMLNAIPVYERPDLPWKEYHALGLELMKAVDLLTIVNGTHLYDLPTGLPQNAEPVIQIAQLLLPPNVIVAQKNLGREMNSQHQPVVIIFQDIFRSLALQVLDLKWRLPNDVRISEIVEASSNGMHRVRYAEDPDYLSGPLYWVYIVITKDEPRGFRIPNLPNPSSLPPSPAPGNPSPSPNQAPPSSPFFPLKGFWMSFSLPQTLSPTVQPEQTLQQAVSEFNGNHWPEKLQAALADWQQHVRAGMPAFEPVFQNPQLHGFLSGDAEKEAAVNSMLVTIGPPGEATRASLDKLRQTAMQAQQALDNLVRQFETVPAHKFREVGQQELASEKTAVDEVSAELEIVDQWLRVPPEDEASIVYDLPNQRVLSVAPVNGDFSLQFWSMKDEHTAELVQVLVAVSASGVPRVIASLPATSYTDSPGPNAPKLSLGEQITRGLEKINPNNLNNMEDKLLKIIQKSDVPPLQKSPGQAGVGMIEVVMAFMMTLGNVFSAIVLQARLLRAAARSAIKGWPDNWLLVKERALRNFSKVNTHQHATGSITAEPSLMHVIRVYHRDRGRREKLYTLIRGHKRPTEFQLGVFQDLLENVMTDEIVQAGRDQKLVSMFLQLIPYVPGEGNGYFRKSDEWYGIVRLALASEDLDLLREVYKQLVLENARDGVARVEFRTTVGDVNSGSMQPVLESVIQGILEAEDESGGKIRSGLYLGIRKSWSAKEAEDRVQSVVRLLEQWKEDPSKARYVTAVSGFDNLGVNPGFDPLEHEQALGDAKKAGFDVVYHIGENWDPGGLLGNLKQIEKVLKSGYVSRISNTIALVVEPDPVLPLAYPEAQWEEIARLQKSLRAYMRENRIFLDLCPESNERLSQQLRRKEGLRFITLADLLKEGNLVIIGNDNSAFFGPPSLSMSHQFALLWEGQSAFGKVSVLELIKLIKNGLQLIPTAQPKISQDVREVLSKVKTVYYPASGFEDLSPLGREQNALDLIRNLFPNIEKIVAADPIARSPVLQLFEYLFPLLRNPKVIWKKQDIEHFELQPAEGEGGTVAILVRNPGRSGYLSETGEIYKSVVPMMRVGNLLVVNDAVLPSGGASPEVLGLEEIRRSGRVVQFKPARSIYSWVLFKKVRPSAIVPIDFHTAAAERRAA